MTKELSWPLTLNKDGRQVGFCTLGEGSFLFAERNFWSNNLLWSIRVSLLGCQLPPMLRKQSFTSLQSYKKVFVYRLFGGGKCWPQLAAPSALLARSCLGGMFFRPWEHLLKILEDQFGKGLWERRIGFDCRLMCPCSGHHTWKVAEPGEGVAESRILWHLSSDCWAPVAYDSAAAGEVVKGLR